ncbi:hypothetical protein EW145_g2554 [Phellinidium pouzarii]|uniref:Condensation domain-containing protein n=1 Tax=Phellinidium pouzarii TaxID=167371 RepID=A0A4S4LAU7_9AGAM|nr:hypothetical protein EW145_g2554 [Phellinidium pouzarii]
MQSDYNFSSPDGGKTWTRKTFGVEQLVAVMSSKTPGFGSLTGGYVVAFPHAVSAEALRRPLEAAWIRLRKIAPVVAYKTKDTKNPEYSLYLEYTVPADAKTAQKWAEETIHWHKDKMSIRERDIAMKNNWWPAAEGHYNYELHIAPDVEDGKWQIMMNSAHWSSDVRGTLQLSELLFTYLNEYMVQDPPAVPSLNIKWGSETAKLTPPGVVAAAIASGLPMSTLFPKLAPKSHDEPMDSQADAPSTTTEVEVEQKSEAAPETAPPAGPVLFFRPTPVVDAEPKYDARACDIWLTAEESAKFRNACRAHKVTVTQAITALMAVAEVEWVLKFTQGGTEEERKQTIETFENATHIISAWNVVDQRYKLKDYARHDSVKGSPPFSAEGFPLMIDMATVREAVKYNKTTGEVERDTSAAVFWDVVARMCQDLWHSSDSDLPAYMQRELMCQAYSKIYDPTSYMIPLLMSSSVGDIEKLGLLTAFSPAVPSNAAKRLLIEQVSVSVRCPTPAKMVLAWQWNKRLLIRPQTAARWTSEKGMQEMGQVMKSWIDATCQ